MIRVLGLVTARGGSKTIPRKNLRLLGGKPLLQYTAEAAMASQKLTTVILSTEDPEIAEVGRSCGLHVPFMRPHDLAQDSTPSLPVVQHAVTALEEAGQHYDAVCLLQPTAPYREPEQIDACISLLEDRNADAVVTMLEVPDHYNPHWVFFADDQGILRLSTGEANPIPRRQELPAAYHRAGSVYVTRRDVIMNQNSLLGQRLYGYQVDADSALNIDTPADWERAENLLEVARSMRTCIGSINND